MKGYNSEPGLFSKVDKNGLWILPILFGIGMIIFYILVVLFFIWIGPSDEPMETDNARTLSSILSTILCNGIYFSIAIISIYTGLKWKKRSAT